MSQDKLQDLYNQLFNALNIEHEVMVGLRKNAEHSEPMHAHVDLDFDTKLWFYINDDNRVASGGRTMVQFVSKEHKLFACMSGQLKQEKDRSVIDKFWSNEVEAWFEQGKEDPKLKMMRFDIDSAEIWTRSPSFTGALKLAAGAKVEPSDVGEHALVEIE